MKNIVRARIRIIDRGAVIKGLEDWSTIYELYEGKLEEKIIDRRLKPLIFGAWSIIHELYEGDLKEKIIDQRLKPLVFEMRSIIGAAVSLEHCFDLENIVTLEMSIKNSTTT